MALKIRLRRQGRRNSPFYRLVVTDSRSPRDGRYLEALGWYNPVETNEEKVLFVKNERIQHWLDHGAELSDKAEVLVGKGAPEVMTKLREKQQAHRVKMAAKRRARNKKAKEAKK